MFIAVPGLGTAFCVIHGAQMLAGEPSKALNGCLVAVTIPCLPTPPTPPHMRGSRRGAVVPSHISKTLPWSPLMPFRSTRMTAAARLAAAIVWLAATPVVAADEPDLIFRRSTVFKLLSPDDKLATYGVDDPAVEGVACHFTVPEKGGYKGWLGLAEEVSDISLACRQIGPIRFKAKAAQGEDMFRQRRSLFFKKMQIVRGCDAKRNVLVYMVYSDRLIEGSPKNSTSSVPVMPWGSNDTIQKCSDFISG